MKEIDADNMIEIDGLVHALTKQDINDPDAPLGNPCSLCSLDGYCKPTGHPICLLLDATTEEYFVKVGYVNRSEKDGYQGLGFFDQYNPE